MGDRTNSSFDNPALKLRVRKDFNNSYDHSRSIRNNLPDSFINQSVNHKKQTTLKAVQINQKLALNATQGAQSIETYSPTVEHIPQNILATSDVSQNTFQAISENIEPAPKKRHIKDKKQIMLLSSAAALFIAGLVVVIIGIQADHISRVQAAKLTQQVNQTSSNGSPSSTAISTVKPTVTAVASYAVAPNLPKYINIPSQNIHSRIFGVGVNSSGALETPNNVYDTAWYNESSTPGQQGAMLIDGHISSWTTRGVFYGLNKLKPGDTIQIIRGDNVLFNYKVVKTQTFDANNVDMQSAITPVTEGKPGLNLISCSGDVISGTSEFNKRIIVYTEQVGS